MTLKLFRFVPFFSFFLLLGCQDIFECIVNREAQLNDKSLQTGFVDNYYYETIHAEVRNAVRDNDYFYYFTVSDDLPLGLDVYFDYRTIIIEGYPESAGDFTINVHLQVEYDYSFGCESEWNDCDQLCDDDDVKDYYLTVL